MKRFANADFGFRNESENPKINFHSWYTRPYFVGSIGREISLSGSCYLLFILATSSSNRRPVTDTVALRPPLTSVPPGRFWRWCLLWRLLLASPQQFARRGKKFVAETRARHRMILNDNEVIAIRPPAAGSDSPPPASRYFFRAKT